MNFLLQVILVAGAGYALAWGLLTLLEWLAGEK